ncbi:MAG: DEAD/DEAH box helicase [Chloroflexi bacterium]|nr:DEAD/DEAH box helicase [Chloroflexota bacterium]
MPLQPRQAGTRSNNRQHTNSPQINRPQQHPAICADCQDATTVPFRPTEGRPVYCSSCLYLRRNGVASSRPAQDRKSASPAAAAGASRSDAAAHESVFRGMVLNPGTRAAIAGMNISDPTPIQEQSIPPLLEGRDLIGQARTGSGKTLAFAVPLVEQCDATARQVQALVLVPTRELAIQVGGVVEDLARPQGLHVTLLYGGRSLGKDHRALQQGAQIIIGTPGRTLDHVRQGSLKLRSVRFLVLDEADEMLDRGFARDVDAILSETPTQRQTALFSATVPDWVAKTARKHLHDPVTVAVDADLETLPSVEHLVYSIQKTDKMEALLILLDRRDGAPVLVFGKTKHGVKRLARQLDEAGYPVGALQGNLSQVARERVMQDFRSGVAPILVATNVAARGLDVEGIGQVINYDLPDSEQLFTHRVGRTGRMGRAGEAITFITPDEDRKWREIERGLGREFTRKSWTRERRSSDRRQTTEAERSVEARPVRLKPAR